MKTAILILAGIFVLSCASNFSNSPDEKITITGTRVAKSSFKDGELEEIDRRKGESFLDMLMRVKGIGHYPKIGSFDSCSELLRMLRDKNIDVLSVEPNVVVVSTNGKTAFKYEFENEECPV